MGSFGRINGDADMVARCVGLDMMNPRLVWASRRAELKPVKSDRTEVVVPTPGIVR